MQIVSDCGMDLSPEQLSGLEIHSVPLTLTLDGKSYRSGIDIQPEEFYRLLDASDGYPTTSQPAAGDFAELYRSLAKTDPEILSIHVSSGLSGTLNAARAGAAMVPEAHVTIWDTKTLSSPEGWQVEAAARAIKAGWTLERTLALLEKVRGATEAMYTLATLKYLIHGGRISHLRGLLASILNIKPVIGVEKEHGKYVDYAKEITLKRAIVKMADLVTKWHPEGSALRVQPLQGNNPEGVEMLCERLNQLYKVTFMPTMTISPVFGAHTGTGLVGMAFGPAHVYEEIPNV